MNKECTFIRGLINSFWQFLLQLVKLWFPAVFFILLLWVKMAVSVQTRFSLYNLVGMRITPVLSLGP